MEVPAPGNNPAYSESKSKLRGCFTTFATGSYCRLEYLLSFTSQYQTTLIHMFRKIIKIVLISLVVLISIAIAAPYLFKKQIVAKVKTEINKKVNAHVDFTDVDISFFRHFPKVAIGLDDLRITGNGVFAGDTLVSAGRIDAAADIMSVLKGKDMTIYDVIIESPRIHAIINKDSLVNWDIMKPDATAGSADSSSSFKAALQHYAIKNAWISYRDIPAGINTLITGLDHDGDGDFTADKFTLNTHTQAGSVTVNYDGIPYLYQAKLQVDAAIAVDNKTSTYRFNTDKITLNDLQMAAKGFVTMLPADGYDMDISFTSASTDFKYLLSLVPTVYQHDFDKVTAKGTAAFDGFVKGRYTENQLPAYHIGMTVTDGYFKYSDLPKPVQHINITAIVDNPDGQTDNNIVNIEKAHFEMDNDPFDFRLLVKKPISNLFVDAAAKGKLDLAKLAQLVKLDAGTTIKGLLNADVNVKGNVKDIEAQRFDHFSAGGVFDLSGFSYASKDYPTGVKINNLQTQFTPAKVSINELNGQYQSTNFSGSGQINNLLNYLLQDKPLRATLTVSADNINLNDWMGTSTDSTATGAQSQPFAVPGNLDILVNSQIASLKYDNLAISNMTGAIKVNDETVTIADVKGKALDGDFAVSGTYSTRESKTKPAISFMYDVEKVDVQKTFKAFNTVQALMPIGKFLAGKLTSRLTVNGNLGDNMQPQLNSLTGNGSLLLIEGFLSKFAPLDKIATTLNVKELEQLSVKDVKNYIEFSNGQVLVKPFTVKVKDIDIEAGGLQGFDQSLDYTVNLKLPRTLMGTKGNQLVNNLVSDLQKKGIPVNPGEVVPLTLKVGGYITSPTVSVDLKQGANNLVENMKQQALDFAKAKIDSTRQAVTTAVKDSIASVKKQAVEAAKTEVLKQITGGKNSDSNAPKAKPEESVKGLLNNLFKKKAKDTGAKQ